MKNARIGLLMLSLFMFQLLESKQQNNNQKSKPAKAAKPAPKHRAVKPNRKVVARPTQQVAREQDSHEIVVESRPVERNEYVAPSVVTKYEQEADGTLVETQTTVQVENDQVVTKTESWTLKDYAKAAAIGAGALGAIGAGYYYSQNQDAVNQGASNLYGKGQGLFNDASNWLGLSHAAIKNQEEVVTNAVIKGDPVIIATQQANLDALNKTKEKLENGEPVTAEEQSMLQQIMANPVAYAQENPKTAALATAGAVIGTGLTARYAPGAVRSARGKFGKNLTPEAQAQQLADDAAYQLGRQSRYSRHASEPVVEPAMPEPTNVSEAMDQAAAKATSTEGATAQQAPSFWQRMQGKGGDLKQGVQDKYNSAREAVSSKMQGKPLTEEQLAAREYSDRLYNQGIVNKSNVNLARGRASESLIEANNTVVDANYNLLNAQREAKIANDALTQARSAGGVAEDAAAGAERIKIREVADAANVAQTKAQQAYDIAKAQADAANTVTRPNMSRIVDANIARNKAMTEAQGKMKADADVNGMPSAETEAAFLKAQAEANAAYAKATEPMAPDTRSYMQRAKDFGSKVYANPMQSVKNGGSNVYNAGTTALGATALVGTAPAGLAAGAYGADYYMNQNDQIAQ